MIVVSENVVRARNGQFVFKDQVLLFTTFSFWFSIENWCRVIVVAFCFHCLSPLELELVELSDSFLSLQLWYTTKLIPAFLIVVVVYVALFILNFSLNWVNLRLFLTVSCVATILLTFVFLIMLWDFILASSSGVNFSANRGLLLYNNTRSSISYDATLGVDDLFDWHMSNNSTFIFRFEDAYCFFLQLFNITALYTLVFIMFFFCVDALITQDNTSLQANNFPNFLYVGVILRWFDHVWFSLFVSHFSIFFVSLRIFLKVCSDFNF